MGRGVHQKHNTVERVNLSADQVPDLKWLSKFGNPTKASSLGESRDDDPWRGGEGFTAGKGGGCGGWGGR